MHASLLLLLPWALSAAPPEPALPAPVRLHWTAPPPCPDTAAVQQQTERLLGRPLGDPRHPPVEASVQVRRQGGWTAELRLTTAGGQQTRRLRARSCEALAEATALLLALTVDPTANLTTPEPVEPVDPAPEPVDPPPEPVEAPPEPVAAPAPASQPPAPVVLAPPPPAPLRRNGVRGFVAAGVHTQWGALPGLGLGLLAAGGLRWRHARVQALASYASTIRERELAAAPEVRLRGDGWWLGLTGCAALSRGRVELPLCGGWFAGAVRTRARGLASGDALRLPWTGALVDAGLRVLLHPRVALAVQVGAQIPVLRPTFRVDGLGVVHQTSPVVAHAQLGLEIRLP